MSIETYEQMLNLSATDAAIAQSEAELSSGGELHDATQALAALRRKHFG